jgi:hypothetical protein
MFWTLDILSTSDEEPEKELTRNWEKEIDESQKPKIKFPIKATLENVEVPDLLFPDPKISNPVPKKKDEKNCSPKFLDISKKKKTKENKSKLF